MGVQGARDHLILVLRECIWNTPAVSLVLQTFDDSGSMGYHPRQVVYPPVSMVLPWVTASRFLAGNRDAEPPFSLHSYFSVFSCLSSFIVTLSAACCVCSLIIIIFIYLSGKRKFKNRIIVTPFSFIIYS